ncbi:DUF192 domain-containing protein [Candidatus Woesearchaeota archaeon]|nr:DUF192 domain-containing protein [Candidatus Woesearchaeota archaeon]
MLRINGNIVFGDRDMKICKSLFSQAIGLMFSRKMAAVFEFNRKQQVSLHMFFVFYSIDVAFLDQNKRVIEIGKDFKPFRFYKAKNKVKYLVEMPAGIRFSIGDRFSWD